MRVDRVEPPREFGVGHHGGRLRHVADVHLEPDEVVTFRTTTGTEFDVTRKAWGYYGSPSLNGRLRDSGLRAALASGVPRDGEDARRLYLLLVEQGREREFAEYLRTEEMHVVAWLDGDEAVAEAARRLTAPTPDDEENDT